MGKPHFGAFRAPEALGVKDVRGKPVLAKNLKHRCLFRFFKKINVFTIFSRNRVARDVRAEPVLMFLESPRLKIGQF